MKIIDILNKMANGTLEDGFKFVYEDKVYTYIKDEEKIINNNTNREIGRDYKLEKCLNDEALLFQDNIEAVTTEKIREIEELGMLTQETKGCDGREYTELKPASAIDIHNKINELVRAVNKLNKEREEK